MTDTLQQIAINIISYSVLQNVFTTVRGLLWAAAAALSVNTQVCKALVVHFKGEYIREKDWCEAASKQRVLYPVSLWLCLALLAECLLSRSFSPDSFMIASYTRRGRRKRHITFILQKKYLIFEYLFKVYFLYLDREYFVMTEWSSWPLSCVPFH